MIGASQRRCAQWIDCQAMMATIAEMTPTMRPDDGLSHLKNLSINVHSKKLTMIISTRIEPRETNK
jgi:hypothetical protein